MIHIVGAAACVAYPAAKVIAASAAVLLNPTKSLRYPPVTEADIIPTMRELAEKTKLYKTFLALYRARQNK